MGTIQNSINQAIGTATGAVAMGKHLSQQNEAIAKQKEANELAKINATDKAIDEYIQSGKDAIAYINETEPIKKENEHIKQQNEAIDKQQEMWSDAEMWADEPEGPQAMAFESSKQSLKDVLSAKRYQANLIKLRMNLQDTKWNILGIDREDLRALNSPEEQKKIREFRGGKSFLDSPDEQKFRGGNK